MTGDAKIEFPKLFVYKTVALIPKERTGHMHGICIRPLSELGLQNRFVYIESTLRYQEPIVYWKLSDIFDSLVRMPCDNNWKYYLGFFQGMIREKKISLMSREHRTAAAMGCARLMFAGVLYTLSKSGLDPSEKKEDKKDN